MAVKIENTKSMKNMQSIAQKGVEEAGNKIIKNIPLDMIDYHPFEKSIFMLNDIDGLAASIERNGFIGGIDVYLMPSGRYQISSGHRRFEAVKKLGLKTIPAIVTKLESAEKVNRKFIESNINTRNLSAAELSNSIIFYENILLENNFQGSINDELSKVFGMSVSKILQLKAIAKLADGIKEMAKAENFPFEAFYEAASFNKADQQKLYEMIKDFLERFPETELSSVVVKQFINKIKEEIRKKKEDDERIKIKKKAEDLNMAVANNIAVESGDTAKYKESYEDVVVDITSDNGSGEADEKNVIIQPVQTVINPESLVKNSPDKKIEEEDKANSKAIDYDLQLYVGRIRNVIEKDSIISDKSIIPDIIEELKDVIKILEGLK